MDCMEALQAAPDNYWDLAIVDPPYGINRDKEVIKEYTEKRLCKWKKPKHKNYIKKDWDKQPPNKIYFDELFRVNVKSVWLGMRFAKPIIAERGGGAIINTASAAGLTATPTLMGYGASKHAVVGMTKTAAVEMAPMGIRVNCICPGIVSTQMIQTIENKSVSLGLVSSADQYQQAYSDRTPLKRYVEASEVAALAAFLGSDEGGMITGETSVIDGGFLQS